MLVIEDLSADWGEGWYPLPPQNVERGRWPKTLPEMFDVRRKTRKRLTSSFEVAQLFAHGMLVERSGLVFLDIPRPEQGRFETLLAVGFNPLTDGETPESILMDDEPYDEGWNGVTYAGDPFVASYERDAEYGAVRGDTTDYAVFPKGASTYARLIFITPGELAGAPPAGPLGPRVHEEFVLGLRFILGPGPDPVE